MKLISTDELEIRKAGDFSPEMLVAGKGNILSAHDWSEGFKRLKLERDEARAYAMQMRAHNGYKSNDEIIFPWENAKVRHGGPDDTKTN